MTTNDLDQAREWAEYAKRMGTIRNDARAAIDLIASLPDEWIDADKLRDVIGRWDALLADDDHEDMHGMLDDLRALLPALQPRPEDVPAGEPWLVEFDGQQYTAERGLQVAEKPWGLMFGWVVSDSEITLVSRLVPEDKA